MVMRMPRWQVQQYKEERLEEKQRKAIDKALQGNKKSDVKAIINSLKGKRTR